MAGTNTLAQWAELRNQAWNGYAQITDALYAARVLAPDEPSLESVDGELWRLADAMRSWDKAPTPTPKGRT